MKKIMLLSVAVIILFCIVPISTAHALQHRAKGHNTDAIVPAFNQKKLCDIIMESSNPAFMWNLISNNMNGLHRTLSANGGGACKSGGAGADNGEGAGIGSGKSKGSTSPGNTNQNVQRRELGHSDRDNYNVDENKAAENKEPQWPKGEWSDAEYPED